MFFVNCFFAFSYILPYTPISPINKQPIVFFTGGNSLMPPDIYSSFVNKLTNDYEVFVIKNNNKNSIEVLEKLYERSLNGPFLPIGHSSGCTTLLNYCSKLNNVKKCVLLDPVNNNLDKNLKWNKFESVLQINAEKATKWKFNDGISFIKNPIPKVPFIPAFSLDTSKFENITKIEVLNYGHCDILDTAFSNIMHNSFAEGNENRETLDDYKDFLVFLIDSYYKDLLYKTNKYTNKDTNRETPNNNFNANYQITDLSLDRDLIRTNFGMEYKLLD